MNKETLEVEISFFSIVLESWALFRKNYLLIAGVSLISAALVPAIGQLLSWLGLLSGLTGTSFEIKETGLWLLATLVGTWGEVALIKVLLAARKGQKIKVTEAYLESLPYFLPVFILTLPDIVIKKTGVFNQQDLLSLGWFLVILALTFVPYVIVDQGLPLLSAIKVGLGYFKDHWWKVFYFTFLSSVGVGIIMIPLIMFISGIAGASGSFESLIIRVVSSLLVPFLSVLIFVFYLHIKEIKGVKNGD